MPIFDNAFHQLSKIEVGSAFDPVADFVPIASASFGKQIATPIANVPTPICQYHTISGVNVAPTVAVAPKDTQTLPLPAIGLSVFVGVGWIQTTGAIPLSFDADDLSNTTSIITGVAVSSIALQIQTNSRSNYNPVDPTIANYSGAAGFQNRSFFKSVSSPTGAQGAQLVFIHYPTVQLF